MDYVTVGWPFLQNGLPSRGSGLISMVNVKLMKCNILDKKFSFNVKIFKQNRTNLL